LIAASVWISVTSPNLPHRAHDAARAGRGAAKRQLHDGVALDDVRVREDGVHLDEESDDTARGGDGNARKVERIAE
jgi:hypothetical protein